MPAKSAQRLILCDFFFVFCFRMRNCCDMQMARGIFCYSLSIFCGIRHCSLTFSIVVRHFILLHQMHQSINRQTNIIGTNSSFAHSWQHSTQSSKQCTIGWFFFFRFDALLSILFSQSYTVCMESFSSVLPYWLLLTSFVLPILLGSTLCAVMRIGFAMVCLCVWFSNLTRKSKMRVRCM